MGKLSEFPNDYITHLIIHVYVCIYPATSISIAKELTMNKQQTCKKINHRNAH